MISRMTRSIYFWLSVVAVIYLVAFGCFIGLEKRVGDFDHDTRFSFPVMQDDSKEYAILGNNIMQKGVFSLNTETPHHFETFRTPLYPLFVGVIYRVFGTYYAVSLAQILLLLATTWLIFKMASQLVAPTLATVAALCYALNPVVIIVTLTVLSEALFIFLFTVLAYVVFFIKWPNQKAAFLPVGLLVGILTLIRPTGLFLAPLLIGFYAWRLWATKTFHRRLLMILVFIVGVCLPLTPWLIRNHTVSGVWSLSSQGSSVFFRFFVPGFISEQRKISLASAQSILINQLPKSARSANGFYDDLSLAREMNQVVKAEILRQPIGYSYYHLSFLPDYLFTSTVKTFLIYLASLSGGLINAPSYLISIVGILENIFWFGLFLSLIWALIKVRPIPPFMWFSFLVIILFGILTGPLAPIGATRYSLPTLPFFLVAGLYGVEKFLVAKKTPVNL